MHYNFIKNENNLIDRIKNHYGINDDDLDINKYENIRYDSSIKKFKEILLSLKDKYFLIIGDGDCDGICATAIIKRLLDYLNIKNNYYIPSRIEEGFGINDNIIELAHKHHNDVILALDNGIANYDAYNKCHEYNIKYLVIDHHEYENEVKADAYIHPDILSDDFKNLSAAGLAYLLSSIFYDDELSLVYAGIALLADMVGVLRYNRYLIKKMLNILNTKKIYQINYLAKSTSYTYKSLSFDVIPKINTFARLGLNVNLLVKYLLADEKYCDKYSKEINKYNDERKKLTNQMTDKVKEIIDLNKDIIVIEDETFKEGLCGLISNKLLHEYKKPTLVFAYHDDLYKGSGRSLKDFDLFNYLKDFNQFESFGGHPQALGLSIKNNNYPLFLEYISSHKIQLNEYIEDVFILNDDELNLDTYYLIESLAPFGIDFKEILFGIEKEKIIEKRIMAKKYPKFIINNKCSAISFNEEYLDKEFDYMIGKLNIDKFDSSKLSFMIEELI